MAPRIYFNQTHQDPATMSYVLELTIKDRILLSHEAVADSRSQENLQWILDLEMKKALAEIVDHIIEKYLSENSPSVKQIENGEVLEGEIIK